MADMQGTIKVVSEGSVPSPPAAAEKFSSNVWQAEILTRLRPDGMRGHRFAYAPGARSNWHVHTGEQAIIVVAGRGLLQWEGLEAARILEPGDWVHVLPGVAHWHGAAPDSVFVHLAITATGETEWGHSVGDAEYHASQRTEH